ncbi:hypothetical protein [Acidithiobacillus concretivorus]|uniref:Uncharacterized protein n=1 Tax=Acidithiobacillus concretivorus TaxID=3063952 RepID=A0ABS5ZT06_9PROT|nr:hypothetical protein [Acidithiobacillus concretivorus]MBU2739786.1 hypothetical protein [Acidithiobacillus concretivorus]
METSSSHQISFNEAPSTIFADFVRIDLASHQGHTRFLQISRSTFDQLSLRIGNAHKVRQWCIAHYHDVDNLSTSAIERYLSLMIRARLELEQRLTVCLMEQ